MGILYSLILFWDLISFCETYFFFFGNNEHFEEQINESEEIIERELGPNVLRNVALIGDLFSIFVNCGMILLIHHFYPTLIIEITGICYALIKVFYLFIYYDNDILNLILIYSKCIIAVMSFVYILF